MSHKFKTTALSGFKPKKGTLFLNNRNNPLNKLYTQNNSRRSSFDVYDDDSYEMTGKGKLWIKDMLKDLENGQGIDEKHVEELAIESIENFIENV